MDTEFASTTTLANRVTRAERSYQCAFQWNEEANQGDPLRYPGCNGLVIGGAALWTAAACCRSGDWTFVKRQEAASS